MRSRAAWCWLAYRVNCSGRTIPVSRFSLTTCDYDRLCTTCYAVFHLFIGCRHHSTSGQCVTYINAPVLPRVLVRESQFAALEAELKHGQRDTARETTVCQRFRSQPRWITVPVGPAGYIPREDVLRVRDHLSRQWNLFTYTLDSQWTFFTGSDPTQ